MRTIKAHTELITPIDGAAILKRIEEVGRVCYKSEDLITDTTAPAGRANSRANQPAMAFIGTPPG